MKKRIPSALPFLVMEILKKKSDLYIKKCYEEHVDLLLRGENDKWQYVLIKDFNTFMYDYTLHRGRKLHVLVQNKY